MREQKLFHVNRVPQEGEWVSSPSTLDIPERLCYNMGKDDVMLPNREDWPYSCAFCESYKMQDMGLRGCESYADYDCKGNVRWRRKTPLEQRQSKPPLFGERGDSGRWMELNIRAQSRWPEG